MINVPFTAKQDIFYKKFFPQIKVVVPFHHFNQSTFAFTLSKEIYVQEFFYLLDFLELKTCWPLKMLNDFGMHEILFSEG